MSDSIPLFFDSNIVPSDKDYEVLRDNQRFTKEKQFIEKLWRQYQPYADRQFLQEAASQFHSRFWEMYLACALTDHGCHLIPKNWEEGPDLCLKLGNYRAWIEAVAPKAGNSPDAVPEFPNDQMFFTVPEDRIILRYLSVVSGNKGKHDRYLKYLHESIVANTEPYVIAINGGDIPFNFSVADDEIPSVVKAVLPLGSLVVPIDSQPNGQVDEYYQRRPEIAKASGKPVPTRIFLDPKYAGISGILFSNADIWNCPHELGLEFIFVHNKMASNRLPQGWLKTGWEFWVEGNVLRRTFWNALV